MKLRFTSLAIVVALMGTFAFGASRAAAAPIVVGGANGLVTALVDIALDDVVEVNVVDSLNNLRALNNILNNSPILSNNDVDVTVGDISILDDLDINVEDVLNDLDLDIDDVIAVGILDGGDIIFFV